MAFTNTLRLENSPRSIVHGSRTAFTILELLVSITVIGVLIALLLPAVHSAREAARKTECRNHLKQLSLAAQLHVELHGHYPTGGWGWRWVGSADAGFDRTQPGGWVFGLLPFIEQSALRDLGQGEHFEVDDSGAQQRLRTGLPMFHCPSRRDAGLYPYTSDHLLRNLKTNPLQAAKSDYAINGGDTWLRNGPGPKGISPRQIDDYEWPDLTEFSGLSFVRSEVRPASVTDGLSHTLLLAEKFVPVDHYVSGLNRGDDQTMYVGDDADIRRWTFGPPLSDTTPLGDNLHFFGGPHPGGVVVTFADGSVTTVSFTVDSNVFRSLGNRRDGE